MQRGRQCQENGKRGVRPGPESTGDIETDEPVILQESLGDRGDSSC